MSTGRSATDYLKSAYPFAVIREKLRHHPGPYLDFAIGRNTEPPPDWLPEFVREHAALALRRARPDEIERLVDRMQETLRRVYDVRASTRAILAAPSGRAAMGALAAAAIAPGDGVLVTEPGYPAFARLAAQRHAGIVVCRLAPDHAFEPDLDGLDPAELRSIRFVGLNYPNNPTGTVPSSGALAELGRRVAPEAILFNDGIYGPLTYGRSSYSMLGKDDSSYGGRAVLELHSLGKLFATGPLGVAFLVGREDRLDAVRQYSDYAWTQLTSLQVVSAARCLEHWEHVQHVRDRFGERLRRLRQVVEGMGFKTFPVEAGMYLLCRSPTALAGHALPSASACAELLLREHGLAVAPWDVGSDAYLRFSAAYLPEELEALAALGPVLSPESG